MRTGRWAPFVVTVDNRGPALQATVSLEVFRGSELRGTLASRRFERDVQLPARSRRRFSFAAPIETVPRPAVARVSTADGEEERELARAEVPLARIATGGRIVVAVSSEIALDFLGQEGVRVVYPHAENLPESWVGWSGVDLVVVRDTAFHRLAPAQATALERWVRAGGTIVFTGGTTALQLASSGLAGLVPVEVTGLVERAGLPSLGRLAGSAARAGAEVLAAEGGLPLVAVRPTGAGRSAWIAFDPADRAFASWPGRPALWRLVAGEAAALPAEDEGWREPLDDPWIAPLAAHARVSFPSHARLAVFLAAFLLPSLALLLLPRRLVPRLGPRLRALLLLLLAAGASAAGWFAFNRWLFRGDDFLLEAARVKAGDGTALLSRRLAVCSPSGGSFELSVGPSDSRVEDVTATTRDRPPGSLAIGLTEAATVRGQAPRRFQSRLVVADAVIPFALSAVLAREGDGARLTVENGTGTTIRDAFLVRGAAILPLGDLEPGPALIHPVPAPGGSGARGSAVAIADAGRRAFWERESPVIGRSGPVLVGWLDEPPMAARLGGEPAAASACMVTLEVDER